MEPFAHASVVALIALLAWPIVALYIFARKQNGQAIIWTVLGGLLLLPAQVAIKFPMVPAIDKNSVASLSSLIGCALFLRRRNGGARRSIVIIALSAAYVFGPVITSVLNTDAIVIVDKIVPGVDYYDGVSALLSQSILFATYFVARRYLREEKQNYWILNALVAGGFFMTFPMLFEIRMSPQLSAWIYGYFPSSFPVEMRDGGFRPVVFMNNGLTAAFFLSTACISAVMLWRLRLKVSVLPAFGVVAYLYTVLVLCKSAGALVYSATLGPLVRWTTPRMQIWAAVLLASTALTYPALRLSFLFPTEQVVAIASSLSKERAESLRFRFNQEDALLAHASERLVFGWGRYGRNRVYWESGDDASVTDGLWIITLGQFGLLGFIGQGRSFDASCFQ
jgi:hypothetical protein